MKTLYFSSPKSCFEIVRNGKKAGTRHISLLSPLFPGRLGANKKFTTGILNFHFFHTQNGHLHIAYKYHFVKEEGTQKHPIQIPECILTVCLKKFSLLVFFPEI
jgi:hypothetical protein